MNILNIASIFLGVLAITKPIFEIDSKKLQCNFESIIACILSILLQICYNIYLINIKNLTDIDNIVKVTIRLSEFLIITTILVNVVSIVMKNINTRTQH